MLRRISVALVCLACMFATFARAELQKGDLVAICGDSITEWKLYSVYMQTYMLVCQPEPELSAMQFGWGGDVSWGFVNRVEDDVLRFKPTVATTCYGMNDGGYAPLTEERAERYRTAMTEMVRKFKDGGVRFVVVGSPGAVDTDTFRNDPALAEVYNTTLGQIRDIAKEVAAEQNVAFADVYSPMRRVMAEMKRRHGPEYHLGGADGVHPAENGHLVMAYAFLKALGCSGEIGTITMDLASGKTEAAAGHEVLESSPGMVEIVSERYPFCFTGDPATPQSTRGVIDVLPFNKDLNRLILVVRNAPADKMNVTWGDVTKPFTKQQLETGINLSAEFLDNPFSEPFAQVFKAVREQQMYETPMIKAFVRNINTFKEMAPDEAASVERIVEAMKRRHAELQSAASASVKPVRHRILIEPVG